MVLVVLALTGCTSSGDLGRAPSVSPVTSYVATANSRSLALETDEEREMRARIVHFLSAPLGPTWRSRTAAAHVQAGGGRAPERLGDPLHYFEALRREKFASSTVRFRRVASDVEADIAVLPTTFAAVCATERLNDRRRIALGELYSGDRELAISVSGRIAKDAELIDWFVRSVTFRAESYAVALDRLLIETPHPEARLVDDALNRLAPFTQNARNHRFCV